MKILFCCQFYAPSVGGVQELIRQLSERFVQRGHEVTVATTALPNRQGLNLNGVLIKEFDVHGNRVTGMSGDLESYRDFVKASDFDLMLIYAAQQWTFDALWSVLDDIPYPVIFAPCGFSGFYEPGYASYFKELSGYLNKFDYFIFNASHYRDIDFLRSYLDHDEWSIIPNAANEKEFNVEVDSFFRARHSIPERSFVFLTVGSLTGQKGHQEVLAAFDRLKLSEGEHASLILNGNEVSKLEKRYANNFRKITGLIRTYGLINACRHVLKKVIGSDISLHGKVEGINATQKNKLVIQCDFSRTELIQAFLAADLFVFASKIEHSPLVLFESAAAGTPFLSVDVGNAKEIAKWTGCGMICPSSKDEKGYTQVDVEVLSDSMRSLMSQPNKLKEMGQIGRNKWESKFTWKHVASQYEKLFSHLLEMKK